MKLFQRTLLSFAGAIFLQAVLAGAALAAIFGSMQTEDAARELKTEASAAYDVFNAWKLAFWKDVNDLVDDGRLEQLVAASESSPLRVFAVEERLRQGLIGSGAESVYIKDERSGAGRFLFRDPRDRYAPDGDRLACRRSHPYIDMVSTAGGLWFVGVVRIAPRARLPLDVFLLKRIDEALASQLSYDPMVAVIVSDGMRDIVGRYSSSRPAAGGEPWLENAQSFLKDVSSKRQENSYTLYPWHKGPGGGYAGVVQQSGLVATPDGEAPLVLSTVLTYEAYEARAVRLNGAVMVISLIVAAFTILIALALTRSIVGPIRRLSTAMRCIEEGDYGATAQGPAAGEISDLFAGFNGMARKLETDKSELDVYIEEIEGLREYAERIIDAIHEGLAVVDPEGKIESANRAFAALFGLERPEGLVLSGLANGVFDGALMDSLRATALSTAVHGPTLRRGAHGRSFDIKLYPLGAAPRHGRSRCIVIVEDVSERLASEARVIQADRLASMSMLTAGVAHEINNPLSSILSNVQNLMSENDGGEGDEALRIVERETKRIARIVRQLLDFSTPRYRILTTDAISARCSPAAVIGNLVLLVGYPFRAEARVEIVQNVDPDCPDVAIGEDELTQILLNLMKNALEAIGGEGRIEVRGARAPQGVELSVTDSGPGIPEDIIGRIFDPFFTTKNSGAQGDVGVGLGLSVVYGIVTTRGGSIRAENSPASVGRGRGATLRVFLPAARD